MDKVALVLIGHGSKLPHNKENIEKLAETLRRKSQFDEVEISFMVRDKPTVPEAIDTLVKRGFRKIVLIPAFLAPGVHTIHEIPEMIGLKDEEHKLKEQGVTVIYGEPLGADERIADVIEEKALKALSQTSGQVTVVNYAETIAASSKTYAQSMTLIRQALGDFLNKVPKSHIPIIERVVHTTADPEFAKLLQISDGAVDAGVTAIKSGAKIVTDVKMVKAGINEARVKRFGGKIFTYIDDKRTIKLAKDQEITRSAAAMRVAANEGLDGAILLIGNAPTAAFEVAEQVKQGTIKPALIIAVPVGYVGATESKEEVAALSVPFIIIRGRKGGSAIAVAVFNALLGIAEGKAWTTS